MNLRLLLLDVSERPEGTDEEVAPSVSFTHHSPMGLSKEVKGTSFLI